MLKLYFAAPLFNAAERQFNIELTRRLEERGIVVFLPQRDGAEHDKEHYVALNDEERREAIFAIDRMKLLESDIFLFVLDGRVPDEGASVELGMAYAQKYLARSRKIIVGLHTDSRAAFIGAKVNPMLGQSLDRIFSNEQRLFEYLDHVMEEMERGSQRGLGTVSGLSRTAF